ncbi:MAG: hypothetical protein M3N47_03620 [Chloroflexota bacterium]|nr:hypothetical protein [Chloroflexota bacterium]
MSASWPRRRSATTLDRAPRAPDAQDEQTELFGFWRYHAFITNRSERLHDVDAEHRQHAVAELVIHDLKDQALAHFPSGQYNANSAWTVIACSRTTSAAGPTCSASPTRYRAPWPRSAAGCSRSPDA